MLKNPVLEWACASLQPTQEIRASAGSDLYQIDAGVISHVALQHSARRFIAYFEGSPSEELLDHCLNDLVIPRLVSLDEDLVLHAGVVKTRAGAIGFIGQSGAGKSTLTGSLHRLGLPILSDDAIILRRDPIGWEAMALAPNLRLFPDSIDRLFPNASLGPTLGDYTSKRRISFADSCSNERMAALFVLAPPSARIEVNRLAPSEACMAIVANAFALDPDERIEAARRFVNATAAARNIPVYGLHFPRDYGRLPSVHAAIFDALGLNDEVNIVQ